jgi:hypothetical protein
MMSYKLGKFQISSITTVKDLNLLYLEDRRFNNDIIFLYKLLNNLIAFLVLIAKSPLNLSHRSLRSTNTIYLCVLYNHKVKIIIIMLY